MSIWYSVAFSASLLAIAAFLLAGHWSAWNGHRQRELSDEAVDFYRRQFRRRVQASSLIAVIGCMVLVGHLLDNIIMEAIFWTVVLALVIWMVVLAVADGMASRGFYEMELNRNLKIQDQLRDEIRKYEEERHRESGNGRSH